MNHNLINSLLSIGIVPACQTPAHANPAMHADHGDSQAGHSREMFVIEDLFADSGSWTDTGCLVSNTGCRSSTLEPEAPATLHHVEVGERLTIAATNLEVRITFARSPERGANLKMLAPSNKDYELVARPGEIELKGIRGKSLYGEITVPPHVRYLILKVDRGFMDLADDRDGSSMTPLAELDLSVSKGSLTLSGRVLDVAKLRAKVTAGSLDLRFDQAKFKRMDLETSASSCDVALKIPAASGNDWAVHWVSESSNNDVTIGTTSKPAVEIVGRGSSGELNYQGKSFDLPLRDRLALPQSGAGSIQLETKSSNEYWLIGP